MTKTDYKTGYILAVTRGHNAGACLLKDGEIVFAIEEERLSRKKYDGGPLASIVKTLDYTDKVDALIIAHTQSTVDTPNRIDFSGDEIYTGLARKLGLIEQTAQPLNAWEDHHKQTIDLSQIHHKLHAACAFYRSGFDSAVALIVDGAGTFFDIGIDGSQETAWEVESIIDCDYPSKFPTLYKHLGTRNTPQFGSTTLDFMDPITGKEDVETVISDRGGITKVYEAVTAYCGFNNIEAGKTMGLFPYGKPNENIPPLFQTYGEHSLACRNITIPTYPNGAVINAMLYPELSTISNKDLSRNTNRRDLAYALQTQTQEEMVKLIRKAVAMSGKKNVVISGGYGLNCVANYHYLEALKDEGIEIYVEPISNDAGTSIGAALLWYHHTTKSDMPSPPSLYLGPAYCYSDDDLDKLCSKYDAVKTEASKEDIIDLLEKRNIVSIFQGRCENGPRALGNRSILYDPTDPDGKDFVNSVKHREYFRPFAGTILEEDVHEWFDLRGMKSSPSMMYAVNCQPGVKEKIPAIIHVDDTCRIQTINESENPNYYNLIKAWKERTGVPIIFNTSFNLGGAPLVETLDHAFDTLATSDIQYLYLPEYSKLITIKN